MEDYEVNKFYRIGQMKRDYSRRKPVLISFVYSWKRNEIMKNKKNLKNIYITEVYSKKFKLQNKQKKVLEERNKGNIV